MFSHLHLNPPLFAFFFAFADHQVGAVCQPGWVVQYQSVSAVSVEELLSRVSS